MNAPAGAMAAPLGRMEWSGPVVIWTLVGVTIPVLLTWFFVWIDQLRMRKYNLPPAPPKYPIIGNMLCLTDTTKPLSQITNDLAKVYGPIMLLKLGVQNFVFLSDPEVAIEVLKTQDQLFSNRPPGLLANRYLLYGGDYHITTAQPGDHHSFYRRLLSTDLLGNKKIQSFQKLRREELACFISDILDASVRTEPVNLHVLSNEFTLNVISRMSFSKKFFGSGITDKRQQQWKVVISELNDLFFKVLAENCHPSLKWIDILTGVRRRMRANFKEMDGLLQELVNEHKQHLDGLTPKQLAEYEAKDFMDLLLLIRNGEHGKNITDTSMKAVALDIFVAGSDTSSLTIEWAMAELISHPEMMKRAQEEVDSVVGYDRCVQESDVPRLSYLAAFVKETFRLHGPLPWLLPHSNLVDCKVKGYDIPANSFIYCNTYAINRHASVWENPLKFDPDRFLSDDFKDIDTKGSYPQLMPFGSGRRSCPGANTAGLLIYPTLASLIHCFNWSLPDGVPPENLDMTEAAGTVVVKKIPLRAIPKARLAKNVYT